LRIVKGKILGIVGCQSVTYEGAAC
jgi:hypothetical protein